MTRIIHPKLSYQIAGLCFEVHNELGRFCREKQYADRLEELLKQTKLPYKREVKINKISKNSPKGNIADFIINEKIIIDLKAKKFITKEDYYQMQRYLKGASLKLGMIVNFRNTYLKPKRILNSSYSNSRHSYIYSRHSHRSKGFTLIELLIYIGLFSIATLLIASLFSETARFWAYTQKTDILQDNARTVFTQLTQNIRAAKNVNTPQVGQTSNILELNDQTIRFYLENGSLKLQDQETVSDLTNNQVEIQDLEFTRIQNPDGKPTIQIKTTVVSKIVLEPEQPDTLNFQTTISLR